MQIPTVHNNGTSKVELLEQIRNAYEASRELVVALGKMSPHQRDYYVQGDEAWKKARDEHYDRIIRITNLQGELFDLFAGINDQGND